jgi:hypothetical protein
LLASSRSEARKITIDLLESQITSSARIFSLGCQELCGAASKNFDELGDMKGKGKALGTMGGADIRLNDKRNAYIHCKQAVKLLESVSSPDADVFRQNLALHFPSNDAENRDYPRRE